MTHLAQADDEASTAKQLEQFKKSSQDVMTVFPQIPYWHIANSAAAISQDAIQTHAEGAWWVRPGIALFGSVGGYQVKHDLDLKPVMQLKSGVALVKWVKPGTHVSYGGTFTCNRKTKLAVVPVGYADGYPIASSGHAKVLVGGMRVPVIGRVTMDMIMIDITDVPNVHVGAEVVLLGTQDEAQISADELATWAGTIPYDIFTGISKRMPRVYKD